VTGATGFLGSRAADLLEEHGHDVVRLGRPDGAARAAIDEARVTRLDAGDPAARDLVAGCRVVLHFAGIPDPARARKDPARAIRENAGAALNLLEGCVAHAAVLVYPSTLRAALTPPPDAYALSKRLGELVCELHAAPTLVVRLTSVYGLGQVSREGATGAIASFAARALAGEPITIDGDPGRTRDFVYADDAIGAIETLVAAGRRNATVTIASGRPASLRTAAELVRDAAGTGVEIVTPGGELPAGENESYETAPDVPLPLNLSLEEGIRRYVDWLHAHPAAEGSAAR
jgi:UDP-glucose 4-epimerase